MKTFIRAVRFLLALPIVCVFLMTANRLEAQQVVGVSAVVNISDSSISTFSATEVDYNTAAYYEPYVEGYLYQDQALIGSGSATANTVSNCDGSISNQVAEGCMVLSSIPGPHYQIESDHYLIAAFAYYDDTGVPYYSNPQGYLSGGGDQGSSDYTYIPGGGAVYVTYQYLFLGTTAVEAYAPSTILASGGLTDGIESYQAQPDGTYQLDALGPIYGAALDYGIPITVIRTVPCPIPSIPCAVVNGAKVVITIGVAAYDVYKLWQLWHMREASPVGWPGYTPDSPTLPDGWDVEVDPTTGEPTGDYVKNNPDGSSERLHPELGPNADVHGDHWDIGQYNRPGTPKNRTGRIYPYPDKPGGYVVWN